MPGFLDRQRAAHLMNNEGLAALVLCQPESITYASGAFAGVATFWRRAGAAFLIVPANPGEPVTAIVGDLQAAQFAAQSGIADVRSHRIWVESDQYPFDPAKPARQPRPAQYDLHASLGLLHDVLAEKRLDRRRIGLEFGFVPAADFVAFQSLPFQWVDATRLVERLRAIKSASEIARLHHAAEASFAGLSVLFDAIVPGMTAGQMATIWTDATRDWASRSGKSVPQSSWSYIAVGGDGFAPGGPAEPGDIIKIDIGSVIDGYSSDGARTAVLGTPRPEAQRIHDSLERAFECGLALFEPCRPLRDIHHAVATSMWDSGYETYGRGHFGHGVGASIWTEEWPFIAADSDAVLEPGMVLAYETPWYINGLGGFIIEDQLLVTDHGIEIMATMPRNLRQV